MPHPFQKYLLAIALVLTSIAISIRGSDGKIKLVLHNYPGLLFLMVVVSTFLISLYFKITSRRISSLSIQIREQSKIKSDGNNAQIDELSGRQKEVYDLIISGKTNKEIINELFIEQSTLKSHINQIYKKLNIKSRRELKSKLKH
ncbi:MAG: helix-turn-helix transcriptional regulator [Saprospiraceae bacterium]|nr:helix-turn-helix transcriptional regulator [Saprospiraceae bacterium]MBK7221351.1 helix-turn-helix transcriptional regulator [Saprospiraceae bacterium]MBK8851774.1 helix-turn-helix transcriptional regulator [Saprospiraceae bacterium]MBL0084523.1 helix-turn-helix transcriptional regulator [Saprospiraceae bacterium]